MTKETLVFIFGIILTTIPFLGIPEEWRYGGVTLLGIALIFIGYALRRAVYLKEIDHGNGERGNNSFVETTEKLFDVRGLK
jgi:heme/copper-type cytochrome/quinol oxidase subunit 4